MTIRKEQKLFHLENVENELFSVAGKDGPRAKAAAFQRALLFWSKQKLPICSGLEGLSQKVASASFSNDGLCRVLVRVSLNWVDGWIGTIKSFPNVTFCNLYSDHADFQRLNFKLLCCSLSRFQPPSHFRLCKMSTLT